MNKLILLLALPLLAQQGAVEGVVTDKITKAPVAGVRVRMTLNSEPGRYTDAVTGVDGAYRIENLAPGVYGPWVNPPDGFYAVNPIEFMRKQIRVTDQAARFDIEIVAASVIHGRLFDADRRPVVDTVILAEPIGGVQMASARTGADGRFSLLVAPGTYRLLGRPVSDKLALTYYPGFTEPASAARVVVGEGADLGGYDFRLQAVLGHALRGVVRDDHGKPIANATVVILNLHKDARSNTEGAFELTPIPAGEWRITASVTRDGVRMMGAADVSMPKNDYDKAEVRLDPPFSVDVEIEGAPAKRSPIRIELRPVSGAFYDMPYPEKDGRVRFERVYPGAYRIGVWGFVTGHYVKSIFLGPADVTGKAVELSPASPPLRVVYAPGAGRVTGEVEDGEGAIVVLVSANRDAYVLGADAFTVSCNEKGRFTMNDLRPGDWLALAVRKSADTRSLRERVFGAGLWREAKSFRVAEGETATVQLKVVTNF